MKYYSVLDLAPVLEGGDESQAFGYALDLARSVEKQGYHRYWLAEHHNMTGISSAATSVLIGYIAGGTKSIRVGSGGIMLPNHAPLVIAEQFGTLAALYPGRIDLGLGRAPGGEPKTAAALRRGLGSSGDTFPQDVVELQSYFGDGPGTTGVLLSLEWGQKCRYICWDRVISVPGWLRKWDCHLHLPPISRQNTCCRRLACIGMVISLPRSTRNRM